MGWSSSLVRTLALRAINEDQLDLDQFETWLKGKYAKSYQDTILCYVRRYYKLLFNENLRELDLIPNTIKNNCIKSLIILSKYLGCYEEFTNRLKQFGIKTNSVNSFNAFLRILNGNNSDILKWYREALLILRENERVYLKFLLYSGLRKEEAIKSFNKIIELHKTNRLNEYYDSNLNCLCHFKYSEYIRRTKNCYISFIKTDLLNEIANSKPITYQMIIKRLHRKNIKCRINELRDYYGTFLLNHGILEAEVNLCQGRIPPSIFIKHYWSPKLSELRDRIFKALNELENQIN